MLERNNCKKQTISRFLFTTVSIHYSKKSSNYIVTLCFVDVVEIGDAPGGVVLLHEDFKNSNLFRGTPIAARRSYLKRKLEVKNLVTLFL
jgi:hypothetical protein